MTSLQMRAWLDQEDANTAETIRRHGWLVEYVFGCGVRGQDAEGPPFAYTVGLFGLDHPELLILGVSPDMACDILNELGERIRSGEPLVPGVLVTFDGSELQIMPESVPNPDEILLGADRYYRRPPGHPVPALQLSYNDRSGRFPWDPGYAAPKMQPRPGTFTA